MNKIPAQAELGRGTLQGIPEMEHRLKLLLEIHVVSSRIPWDSEMESSVTRGAASLGAAFFIFIWGRGYRQLLMTNDGAGAKIKHPKLRGEWAELCLMVRAAER